MQSSAEPSGDWWSSLGGGRGFPAFIVFSSVLHGKHFFFGGEKTTGAGILPLHIHPARHAPRGYALVIKIHLQGLSSLLHSGAGAAVCAQVRMKPSVFRGALYHHLRSRGLLKAAEEINDEAASLQYAFEDSRNVLL